MLAAEEDKADLGSISVGNDEAVALFHEAGHVGGGLDDGGVLVGDAHVLSIFDEGIAADGDDQSLHGPIENKTGENERGKAGAGYAAQEGAKDDCPCPGRGLVAVKRGGA